MVNTIVRNVHDFSQRQQLGDDFCSSNKNPMQIDEVQRAVEGRIISLIIAWSSAGNECFNTHIIYCLSMRNFFIVPDDSADHGRLWKYPCYNQVSPCAVHSRSHHGSAIFGDRDCWVYTLRSPGLKKVSSRQKKGHIQCALV